MIDIAVIGAGPAGYSAAITARKRDQSVVVIGQNTGWLARAEHVANYPGLPDISGRDLLSAMANQAQALGAALRPGVVHQPGSQPQPGNTAAVSQRNAFL